MPILSKFSADNVDSQLRDSVGEWRSHTMSKIRFLVASHYNFGPTSDDIAKLAKMLLHDCNFMCQDYRNVG
jgi:Domain of unknown function (DUF6532)